VDTDIAVALIAAGAALLAAAATWVHGNRQLDAERARSAAELAAARSALELGQAEARRTMELQQADAHRTLEQHLAAAREQLRAEQAHELRQALAESRNTYEVELLDRRLDACGAASPTRASGAARCRAGHSDLGFPQGRDS
jgi:hypothetical protein